MADDESANKHGITEADGHPPGVAAPGAEPSPVPDETLDAIDSLEALLQDRHGMASAHTDSDMESDGQYTIPLLNEVVLPGQTETAELPDPPPELSPMAQRLFDRLASEIDVIVQTGVEDALKAAAKDIRKRVRNHVAIVLPEILDELSQGDQDDPML
ncbi:MAG: hypothetical protein AAF458_20910 [Pseudomonadota bacterium]